MDSDSDDRLTFEARAFIGYSSLLAIAPRSTWEMLMAMGEQRARLEPLVRVLNELAELQRRAAEGISQPGDRFRAMRLLKTIPQSDLLRLIFDLGLPDSEAIFPWRMTFSQRPPSAMQTSAARAVQQLKRRAIQKGDEDSIVFRVTKVRLERNYTLPEALKYVAAAHDVAPLEVAMTTIKPTVQSVAKVRKAYMAGIKRAKGYGYTFANRGLFGGERMLPLGSLTKKGRKPKPK